MVNPNRLDEAPGCRPQGDGNLAAVGVAFLGAWRGAARTLRARGFFGSRAEPQLIELLDLVALGTSSPTSRGSSALQPRRPGSRRGQKVMWRGAQYRHEQADGRRMTKPRRRATWALVC